MQFYKELSQRVLVLDGAMGTMIQHHNLTENDFRGTRFANHSVNLKGCNDLLCLTRPDIIAGIHRQYLLAGADIIETNTFNANTLSMGEYQLPDSVVDEINLAAARLARAEVDRLKAETGRLAWVAGSVGPGNISLSIAATTASGHKVTFDEVAEAYRRQAAKLIEGGVDLLLLETIFDTLNAKASIYGVRQAIAESARPDIPLMISVTLTEQGRTLSGQTLKAFVASVAHANPIAIGLNCGFGADMMAPFIEQLQDIPFYVSIHPNAGLPDEMGLYTETPDSMAATIASYLQRGWLNIVGGCCGTTPAHIAAIAREAVKASSRIKPAEKPGNLCLSGMEAICVCPSGPFVKVGERCNVAGSRKFLRLINEGNQSEALEIAASQVDKGALILDINMDDGMLDARAEMASFVELLPLDPKASSVAVMIDSSDFGVIESAMKLIQGRPVVNSISLKEGEEAFLSHARKIRELGGAVVVMAFDEQGQATTLERRIEICRRAYRLLTEKACFKGHDIIFDPNILTVGTGIADHDRYAIDFLDAVSWIKANLPGAKVSGGVSNLSFAFRGNNLLRKAMHTVFLAHAIERGMDMAIIDPATSLDPSTVDDELRQAIDDVIFARHPDAAFRLLDIGNRCMEAKAAEGAPSPKPVAQPAGNSPLSLDLMIVKGIDTNINQAIQSALAEEGSAMAVIKNRLMAGMNRVGEAFDKGTMFLPQVVRSASVMKEAIAILTPRLEAETSASTADSASTSARVVLATVKGDVHDIGKNIVAVVLRCSGFEVVDLGVMVPAEDIVKAAEEHNADIVALSGLITPSLSEMINVARELDRAGLSRIPLFVGGATTSAVHTAVKIAPEYSGTVIHTRDAAAMPDVAAAVTDPDRRQSTLASIAEAQAKTRAEYAERQASKSQIVASANLPEPRVADSPLNAPAQPGSHTILLNPAELIDLINWPQFFLTWQLPTEATDERARIKAEAIELINRLSADGRRLTARIAILPAYRRGDDIIVTGPEGETVIPTLRRTTPPLSAVADFVAPANDHIALFAVTVGPEIAALIESATDQYQSLLLQAVADRLAEAATDRIHTLVYESLWQPGSPTRGIRPAIGYPSLPDQSLVEVVAPLLRYDQIGVTPTENGALFPTATTTGLILPQPAARYFEVGTLTPEAFNDYATRRNLSPDRLRHLLPHALS